MHPIETHCEWCRGSGYEADVLHGGRTSCKGCRGSGRVKIYVPDLKEHQVVRCMYCKKILGTKPCEEGFDRVVTDTICLPCWPTAALGDPDDEVKASWDEIRPL